MPRHIAVFGKMGQVYAPLLAEALATLDDEWQLHIWACTDDVAPRDAAIALCEVAIISPDFVLTAGNFGALMGAPHLKMMVQPWVGVDWIDPTFLPQGLLVCNAGGHGAPMAEYALGAILEHVLELRAQNGDMQRGDWSRSGRNAAPAVRHGDVAQKKLALIGYGEIAQEIAKRARAFDMQVSAIARRKRDTTPPELAWIGTQSDLLKLLRDSDFIVITCDLNEETQGMINADAFAAMKRHAYIVNVARGEIIDEDALFDALKTKRIGGAALDTWYRYPSDVAAAEPDPDRGGAFQGSRHDFLSLDNVLLTPHSAAHTNGADEGRYRSIATSLRQYGEGAPMTRHVITGTGGNPDGFKMP